MGRPTSQLALIPIRAISYTHRMPRNRAFAQVDVFTSTAYLGNPVAVILDAAGLSDNRMQQIARWTNLSETTFVLPPTQPTADYRLRIFTPGGELPFAGHPTLGTAHAWLEQGGAPLQGTTIVQECAAGLVNIESRGEELFFAAPPTLRTGELEAETLAGVRTSLDIGAADILAHQWVDNGPGWAVVQLASAAKVLALAPDLSQVPDLKFGVIGAYPDPGEFAFEIRAFAPALSVGEDPVTGSLNASVAQWMLRSGRVSGNYRVSQGTRLGRAGDVAINCRADGSVWVGGACTTCFHGTALA